MTLYAKSGEIVNELINTGSNDNDNFMLWNHEYMTNMNMNSNMNNNKDFNINLNLIKNNVSANLSRQYTVHYDSSPYTRSAKIKVINKLNRLQEIDNNSSEEEDDNEFVFCTNIVGGSNDSRVLLARNKSLNTFKQQQQQRQNQQQFQQQHLVQQRHNDLETDTTITTTSSSSGFVEKSTSTQSKRQRQCLLNNLGLIDNKNMSIDESKLSLIFDRMFRFEDLQKACVLLRKALKQMKIKEEKSSPKHHQLNDSTSSFDLAFDNLTYSSSVDDLSNNQNDKMMSNVNDTNEMLKKTIKSIKRKDKMRKTQKSSFIDTTTSGSSTKPTVTRSVSNIELSTDTNNNNSKTQTHEDDTSKTTQVKVQQKISQNEDGLTNKEFEKRLRKKYRCKSLARSLRRAKTVYYKNRRSKSLEDLSGSFAELKNKYLSEDELENNDKFRPLSRTNSGGGMSSCSSFTSIGCASDLSSSYFHELSELSPEISDSDSLYSDNLSLDDVDWDANLPDLPMSEFCSSEEDSENDADDEFECDCNFCNSYKINQCNLINDLNDITGTNSNSSEHDLQSIYNILIQLIDQKYNITFETLESLLNEVTLRMLNLHPGLFPDNVINNQPASIEFINNLPLTQVNNQYLHDNKNKQDCSICLASFEMQEDITILPCCHIYHAFCIKVWLSKSGTCPICRFNYTNRTLNNKQQQQQQLSHPNRETLL